MHISDLLDMDKLDQMIAEKRISKQVHPAIPELVIYNYTNTAQFANKWTNEERICRGLITTTSGEIIARGPSKFFNYSQPGAPEVALEDKVWVSRKEDGSLGIGWYYNGQYGVATRGSFASEQALHATEMLTRHDKATLKFASIKGCTEIFEIVYPENRIVLDYGGLDKLIRLGHVSNENGLIEVRPVTLMYGEDFSQQHEMTFAEALALPIPDDEEGYVLDVRHTDGVGILGHIKLKGDRYKELHGAIFGLSERKIWEAIGRGMDMEKFVSDLPDELMPWAQGIVNRITNDINVHCAQVILAFTQTILAFGKPLEEVPRGEIARHWTTLYKDITGPLFAILDDKHEATFEWAHKQVRPEHKLFRVESAEI